MTVASALAIYFVVWWVVLFAVLPFGVRSQHEEGGGVEGTDPGAPVAHGMVRKLVWTTIVSAVLFGVGWRRLSPRLLQRRQLARFLGFSADARKHQRKKKQGCEALRKLCRPD